jgi:hypothetical protein
LTGELLFLTADTLVLVSSLVVLTIPLATDERSTQCSRGGTDSDSATCMASLMSDNRSKSCAEC